MGLAAAAAAAHAGHVAGVGVRVAFHTERAAVNTEHANMNGSVTVPALFTENLT